MLEAFQPLTSSSTRAVLQDRRHGATVHGTRKDATLTLCSEQTRVSRQTVLITDSDAVRAQGLSDPCTQRALESERASPAQERLAPGGLDPGPPESVQRPPGPFTTSPPTSLQTGRGVASLAGQGASAPGRGCRAEVPSARTSRAQRRPPPSFLFHLAGSGAGAASLHAGAGGHLLLLRQGWVAQGGKAQGRRGGAGQEASQCLRAGNYQSSQNQEGGEKGLSQGGGGWGGEEATKKIKKVFRGNKTKENGETGGKAERV